MGKTKLTYDYAIAKLTAIVDEIEGGGLSITALTAKVKEAMSLAAAKLPIKCKFIMRTHAV